MQPSNHQPSQQPGVPPQHAPAPAPGYTGLPQPVPGPIQTGQYKQPKRRRMLGLGVGVAVALLVLTGVGAAAYLGVVLPNKPENRVLASFTNLAAQKHATIGGTVDYENKKATGTLKGVAINYTMATDVEKKQTSFAGTLGIAGAKFPVEVRYVDQDIYFKAGGLDFIQTLLTPEMGALAPSYAQVIKDANNQWYVIDRSFMQQSGTSCVTDISFELTDDDLKKLQAAYEKYPLFTVKSTASAQVDGVAVTKMELDPANNDVAGKFAKELESLSMVSKLRECAKSAGIDETIDDKVKLEESDMQGALFVYITDDNQLRQLEFSSEDDKEKAKLVMKLDYAPVSIAKPESAKPFQDLLVSVMTGLGVDPTLLQNGEAGGAAPLRGLLEQ